MFDDIFNMFMMAGNEEERRVKRYESDDVVVSTVLVTDSEFQYETAISHVSYNNGNWVVVENYETEEEAATGHDVWEKKAKDDALPDVLVDVSGCWAGKTLNNLRPEEALHMRQRAEFPELEPNKE